MEVVTLILFAASLILFFGFFAEWIFKKFNVPDILFLIALGFIIGPHVLNYVNPSQIVKIAPVFTTFTLIFLLFDGAFNIRLSALIKEFSQSFVLTIFNFIISTAIITTIVLLLNVWLQMFSFLTALLLGFLLGGVSSSFAIPILKQMKVSERIYSLLTLESALTDVFCIVFSLTAIEVFRLGGFGVREVLTQIASLFAVAGLIGSVGAVIWIILILKVFKEHNYIMTVAYLLLVYVITQFLNGNGAIAALFFGLILNNSKQLILVIKGITTKKKDRKKLESETGLSVTTPSEEYFYHQISFFLKTFFFVYVGILIDISDWRALFVGGIISVVLMFSRQASMVLTKGMMPGNRSLVNSIFARGLAAAAVAQLAIQAGIPHADFIAKVAYVVITGTIILSSIKVFITKVRFPLHEGIVEEENKNKKSSKKHKTNKRKVKKVIKKKK
jgi:potassium/hydrogen antiporter